MAEYIEKEYAVCVATAVLGLSSAQQNALSRYLRKVPAANVRENVPGEWIEQWSGNGWNEWVDCTCSVCGTEFERFEIKANFCPNCGAEMEVQDG